MSSQTVYFDNPQTITTLQNQVGSVPNQVNTTLVNAGRQFFANKYTFPYGLGTYKVDVIPVQTFDKFSMPKFGSNYDISLWKYTGAYDTIANSDFLVSVPSVRTNEILTPVYKSASGANILDGMGSFFNPFEDGMYIRKYANANSSPQDQISPSLNTKFNTFVNLCQSGTTSSVDRNAALDAIQADSEYQFIRDNIKVPAKIWPQVKNVGGNSFSLAPLKALVSDGGSNLVNTLSDGVSTFTTQVSVSTYSATGNLLPPSQNVNSTGGKMGLFLYFMGNTNQPDNIYNDSLLTTAISSLGYVVVVCSGNHLSARYQTNNTGTLSLSKLLADKLISRFDVNSTTDPYYISPVSGYGSPADNVLGNPSYSYDTFNRTTHGRYYMGLNNPAAAVQELYLYKIKCVLEGLGLADKIDFNNTLAGSSSLGFSTVCMLNNLLPSPYNGISSTYTIPGTSTKPFLYKIKAGLAGQGLAFNYDRKALPQSLRLKLDIADNMMITALNCPMAYVTGDSDQALVGVNQYNMMWQTMSQVTWENRTQTAVNNHEESCTIFVPVSSHAVSGKLAFEFETATSFGNGFLNNYVNGWTCPLQPVFPLVDDALQSGISNNIASNDYEGLRRFVAFQMWAHRYLGLGYPVSVTALRTLGYRVDLGPTHCDILTSFQNVHVGPNSVLSYDSNFDLSLNTKFSAPSIVSTGAFSSSSLAVSTTGSFGSIIASAVQFGNTLQTTQSALSATDTTIAYKIPIVVNGITYYISLTAAQ